MVSHNQRILIRVEWQRRAFAASGEGQDVHQSLITTGLHLNPSGYNVLFDEVMAAVERTWPDQLPENLRMVLPAWDDPKAWA
jgi:hypothetical protein